MHSLEQEFYNSSEFIFSWHHSFNWDFVTQVLYFLQYENSYQVLFSYLLKPISAELLTN